MNLFKKKEKRRNHVNWFIKIKRICGKLESFEHGKDYSGKGVVSEEFFTFDDFDKYLENVEKLHVEWNEQR